MLKLDNITKYYQTKKGKHYVFKDLSFEFPENTDIGILGSNGAGKSTLLRLLGRIDIPNKGKVITDKKISWPIGLAGGFQGSLSARENISFVCQISGCNQAQTKEKIEKVREFADIGTHFDLPIKSYSSGMRARVAFGISLAFDFDYYLVDEVLSVGDQSFKQKSKQLFEEKRANANLLLVSHSPGTIKQMCDVVVVVNEGKLTYYPDIELGIEIYNKLRTR